MKKKSGGIRASVQLSMGEYIETFASLVHEHYQRAMSDEELFSALNLTEEAQAQFSVEYATVLLVIASLAFKVKPKLTTDKYRDRIQERMADGSFRKILTDADDETIAACVTFYQSRSSLRSARISTPLLLPTVSGILWALPGCSWPRSTPMMRKQT